MQPLDLNDASAGAESRREGEVMEKRRVDFVERDSVQGLVAGLGVLDESMSCGAAGRPATGDGRSGKAIEKGE